jgi:hypothetical protein
MPSAARALFLIIAAHVLGGGYVGGAVQQLLSKS